MNGTEANWRPTASFEAMRLRARVLARIRAFFSERGVLEVETPMLSRAASTEPHVESLRVCAEADPPAPLYLHTSPEFAMKRLLAAGSGSIFQLGRAFRDGERGRLHNPEFTMCEWYRVGFDHHRLMDEVEALMNCFRAWPPFERVAYREAFERVLGIDPLSAPEHELMQAAAGTGLALAAAEMDRDDWLDLLLGQIIGPQLGRSAPVFVYDYPASQAALARVRPGHPPLAERFELFVGGMELANGFNELRDAHEQRRRFAEQLARRRAAGRPTLPVDENLLAALAAGMPACAGVALGVDRLLMVLGGYTAIEEVIAFPAGRA